MPFSLTRNIPFNKPYLAGRELEYMVRAHAEGRLAGNGPFTRRSQALLAENLGSAAVLLTHSGTAALEMAALLLDIRPGDEIIMPSFTFVSTANAFVLRGGVPVFVDIRPDTLNIDEKLLAAALTPKTRAVAVVHYAGVACAMDEILSLAGERGLAVVEDAAQGFRAAYKGRPLGTLGSLGALSFHETKNIISGEGGALAVNDPGLTLRAEIIWEKGTDRTSFERGEIDKYTWRDIGSSYLPSEITAAFLLAQLEAAEAITAGRLEYWHYYHDRLAELEGRGFLRRPVIPPGCQPNGHIYHILVNSPEERRDLLDFLRGRQIQAVFHYVPLHSSPAGRRYGRAAGELTVTDDLWARLIRLPLWNGLDVDILDRVIRALEDFYARPGRK